MKNCDEMVNSLLERRDRYAAVQKRKRKAIARTAASTCCVCLVALLGFSVRKSGLFGTASPVTQENANDRSSETDRKNSSDTSSAANDNVTYFPNNYSPNESEKTMISSFHVSDAPSASYVTPENGKFRFSIPLREAMNAYGDTVLYRVVIDVFSGEEPLPSDSTQVQAECERLSSNGYVVAYETFFDGEAYRYYFTIHATYDELTNFAANENYGYFMFLYDERVEFTPI